MRTWLPRLLIQGAFAGVAFVGMAFGGYLAMKTLLHSSSSDYRAAVIRVLDQHGVRYRIITIVDGCAPTYQQCYTYAAAVRVLAEVEYTGQVTCRERWTSCALSVPGLRIMAAPLADTRSPLVWRWQQLCQNTTRWMQDLWSS